MWANLAALKQRDVKRLLAYSSVAQAGYLVIGVVAGTALGLEATLFYALVYVFTNVAAFQVVQLAAEAGRHSTNIRGLHIFTFNELRGTETWRQQLLAAISWKEDPS